MNNRDGMNYAPVGKSAPVVKPGEFTFAAIGLDHGHIYGMTNGLKEAGATLKWVYDPDSAKVEAYRKQHPEARAAESEVQVFDDPAVKLVAAACVPGDRAALGIRVMKSGKDYFTDKAPLISLEQLDAAKAAVRETKRKYMVCYSERLQSESAVYAGQLIEQGVIGRVLQVLGMGPHRLNAPRVPAGSSSAPATAGFSATSAATRSSSSSITSGHRCADCLEQNRELQPSEYPELDDFGDADREQRRDRLLPRRLVHPGRSAHLGRRAHLHPRHGGVH